MYDITGSVVSIEYDPVGRFKLTHEDIELLSKELRDALIPFHQVKITGDLGEGIMTNHECIYIIMSQFFTAFLL